MLDEAQISEIARAVARASAGDRVERVLTAPTVDSDGADALRITLVLRPGAVQSITGDNALDMLVGIRRKLSEADEQRLPIIEYATEAELAEEAEERDEEEWFENER